MEKVVILAPHIDDELIGCYSVLKGHHFMALHKLPVQLTVIYFFDITYDRKDEAGYLARSLGFNTLFDPAADTVEKWCAEASKIYVPSRRDAHENHKELNQSYRHLATHFYSVDMVDASPLQPKDRSQKKEWLNAYYPSQSALWERDHKYFLFESIHELDYDVYSTIRTNNYEVTMLERYEHDVQQILISRGTVEGSWTPRQVFSQILSTCRRGGVEFKCPQTRAIFKAQP